MLSTYIIKTLKNNIEYIKYMYSDYIIFKIKVLFIVIEKF